MNDSIDSDNIFRHQDYVPDLVSSKTTKSARNFLHQMRNKENEMNKILVFFLLAVAILTVGCSVDNYASPDNRVSINGSGNLVSCQIDVSGFDQVEIGFAFNVSIHQGEEFSVDVSIDDNLAEYLYVEVEGNTLKIGLKPGYAYDIPQATMRAEVTMPELSGLHLNGSSHATLSGFKTVQNFSAELTGSSSLSGDIQAQTVNLNSNGSTFVKLSGTGNNLWVDACGIGTVELNDFRVEDATLLVSCASTVVVNVDGRLDVDAAQNAQVYFIGNPAVRDLLTHGHASVQPR